MSKRGFYENDDLIDTKPGYNSKITEDLKQKEMSHGNISFIQGMGIRTTPYLEEYANKVRHFLHEKWSYYGAELRTQKSAALNEYNSIADNISSSIKEPVLPSLIYILTASFSGSILVNKRALPIRFITPILFGGVAFKYLMPQSFEVCSQRFFQTEKENFPELYDNQVAGLQEIDAYKKQLEDTNLSIKKQLQDTVHDARLYILELFSDK